MLEIFRSQPALLIFVAGLVGLIVGSFINVVIHRLPRAWNRDYVDGVAEWAEVEQANVDRSFAATPAPARQALATHLDTIARSSRAVLQAIPDETLWRPRSRCPACGHGITAAQNVPLASFLLLGGKCAACKTPISLRYPLIELACGLLAALIAAKFGMSYQAGAALVLVFWLAPLAMIDADTTWLPNSCTLPLLWLGLLLNLFGVFVPLSSAVGGAVAGYLFLAVPSWAYEWLRKVPQAMGRGDFTLMAALGAWFGLASILPIVLVSSVVALAVALPLLAAGKRDLLTKIPFGPYLACAAVIYLFHGAALARWIDLG